MLNKERYETVFNATFEKWEIQVYTRVFTFMPRSLTKIPEAFAGPIDSEYKKKGLIILSPGDDYKAKEREALKNYLEILNTRIANYMSEWDEAKRRGVTMGEAPALIQAKKWREQILTKLSIEAPMEPEKSFLDSSDLRPNLFEGLPTVVPEVDPLHSDLDLNNTGDFAALDKLTSPQLDMN